MDCLPELTIENSKAFPANFDLLMSGFCVESGVYQDEVIAVKEWIKKELVLNPIYFIEEKVELDSIFDFINEQHERIKKWILSSPRASDYPKISAKVVAMSLTTGEQYVKVNIEDHEPAFVPLHGLIRIIKN